MLRKICPKCSEEKYLSDFYKDKSKKDGLQHHCKSCKKEWRFKNIEKQKLNAKKHYQKNKDYYLERAKKWSEENKEKVREYKKKWEKNNRDKKNISRIKRERENPSYKLSRRIRTLIGQSFRLNGFSKNSKTEKILGISFLDFKKYIESTFSKEMNWDNYGSNWHIDHIIPVSWGVTEDDVYDLNHYSNLRGLNSGENILKSNNFVLFCDFMTVYNKHNNKKAIQTYLEDGLYRN